MQRTYKMLVRGLTVAFFSIVMFSGAITNLVLTEKNDRKEGSAPSNKIFSAFTSDKAYADVPASGDSTYTDGCGDSCDGSE